MPKHGMPIKSQPAGGNRPALPAPRPVISRQMRLRCRRTVLQHLYPALPHPRSPLAPRRIVGFDQTEFFDERDKSSSLHEAGIPVCAVSLRERLRNGRTVSLHVAFHGCEQGVDKIHELFFRDAGYNAWADANHVIVLYPQAVPGCGWRIQARSAAILKAAGTGGAIAARPTSLEMASRCALYER